MDLNQILVGFDQINPGFDLRGDPSELQRYAAQAADALHDTNIVAKTLSYLVATRLRDWHNADSVEERERLHGEVRGLMSLRKELQQLIDTNSAVQDDIRRKYDEGGDFDTL